MSIIRFIGDIHGNFYEYSEFLTKVDYPTIQVGDFGIGFAGDYWHDKVNKFHTDNPKDRFIRGNHDHPARCKDMTGWIKDGVVANEMMLIGGAWSIDNPNADPGWYRRTEGVNWWADEELSNAELHRLLEIYAVIKPSIMVTHDAPEGVSKAMFLDNPKNGAFGGKQYKTRTGQALQAMWEIHQPRYWVFGHWHSTMATIFNGTYFQCVGECAYVDIDTDDYTTA